MKIQLYLLLGLASLGMITMTSGHLPSIGIVIPLIPISVLTGHAGLWGSGLTGAALLKLKAAATIAAFLALRRGHSHSHADLGFGYENEHHEHHDHGGYHRRRRAIAANDGRGETAEINMREYDPSLDEVLQYDQLGCGLRLVCELSATPDERLQEDEKLILELFGRDEKAPNPMKASRGKLTYSYAALLGSHAKDAGTCSRIYGRCPYSATQIMESLRTAKV